MVPLFPPSMNSEIAAGQSEGTGRFVIDLANWVAAIPLAIKASVGIHVNIDPEAWCRSSPTMERVCRRANATFDALVEVLPPSWKEGTFYTYEEGMREIQQVGDWFCQKYRLSKKEGSDFLNSVAVLTKKPLSKAIVKTKIGKGAVKAEKVAKHAKIAKHVETKEEAAKLLKKQGAELLSEIQRYKEKNRNLVLANTPLTPDASHDEKERYLLTRNTLNDGFEIVSSGIAVFGNRKTANSVAQLAKAGLHIMESGFLLAGGASLGGSATSLAVLSPLAPYAAIASGAALLFSLIADEDEGEDGLQVMLREIYHALSQQIADLHRDMLLRFDRLDEKVDRLHLFMMRGFLAVMNEIHDLKAPLLSSLSRIDADIQALHTLANAKLDTLLLQNFAASCSAIAQFQERYKTFDKMQENEFRRHVETLEDWLLGVHPQRNVNGFLLGEDFAAHRINKTLRSVKIEALLGYLGAYMAHAFRIVLPRSIHPENLPNLTLFMTGVEHYSTLRAQVPIRYDEKALQARKILEVGDMAIASIEFVATNKALFDALGKQYIAQLREVYAHYQKALHNKSKELATTVCAATRSLNEATIQAMPKLQCPQWIQKHTQYMGFYKDYLQLALGAKKSREALPHEVDLSLSMSELSGKYTLTSSLNGFISTTGQKKYKCNPIPLIAEQQQDTLESALQFPGQEFLCAERLGLGYCVFDCTTIDRSSYGGNDGTAAGYLTSNTQFPQWVQIEIKMAFKTKEGLFFPINNLRLRATKFSDSRALPNGTGGSMYFIYSGSDSSAILLAEAWKNAVLVSHDYDPKWHESLIYISKAADERLIALRQEVIATLLDPTNKVGSDFRNALEQLDASYNLLQAFAAFAGFEEREQVALAKQLDSQSITTQLRSYLQVKEPKSSPMPLFTDGMLQIIQKHFEKDPKVLKHPLLEKLQWRLTRLKAFVIKQQTAVMNNEKTKLSLPRIISDPIISDIVLDYLYADPKGEPVADRMVKEGRRANTLLQGQVTDLTKKVSNLEETNALLLAKMTAMMTLLEKLTVTAK